MDNVTKISPEIHLNISPLLIAKAERVWFNLALCKGIVDRRGNKIEIESLPNRGATIRINLPSKRE
jgi:light-regulated signal transduction histidine kinase (bacteriophytochrome)